MSVPICQNTFPLPLVKNELSVFSESLGPPPSNTYPFMTIAGLQVPKKAEIYQEIAFLFMKHKPLLKPRSHRFWHDYNVSKHVPGAFATFLQWERVLMN